MTSPIAIESTAGSAPRISRITHHAAASGRWAFQSTLKNFHSLRRRSRSICLSRIDDPLGQMDGSYLTTFTGNWKGARNGRGSAESSPGRPAGVTVAKLIQADGP